MDGKSDVEPEFDSSRVEEGRDDEIKDLMERVSRLEDSVNNIKEQQGILTNKLKEYSEDIEGFQEGFDDIREDIEDLEEYNNIQESRINNINRSLDALEENLESTKGDIDETYSDLRRRLTAIENMLDLDEVDIAQAIKPNASELEQLSTIPEESREQEFNVRVQRAIAVYEHFHDISTPVKSGGERVLSRDVKTFLNGYSNTDIKYTQVQRVIDSFDEKTGDEFSIQQTNDGRAIVWESKGE